MRPLGGKPKTGKSKNVLDDFDVDEEMAKLRAQATEEDLGIARLNDEMAAMLNVAQGGDYNLTLLNDAFEGKSHLKEDTYEKRDIYTGQP